MTTYPPTPTTARILAERALLYRPRLKLLTGNINAAILLSQINYWWFDSKQTPFYKFAAPCGHKLYKSGDSWQEELAFTRTELETALKYIGTKTHNADERTELRALPVTAESPVNQIVLYWRDSGNVTWYELNATLQDYHLSLTYSECGKPAFANVENLHYPANVENLHSTNVENPHYLFAESTTKRKKKDSVPAAQDALPEKLTATPAAIMNPLKDAIVLAMGWSWATMTKAEKGSVQAAAKSFAEAKAVPEDVTRCKAECDRRDWKNYGAVALTKVLSDVRKVSAPSSNGAGKRRRVFWCGAWVDAARLGDDNTIDGQVRPSYTLAEIAVAGEYGGVTLAAGEKVYHDGSLPLAWQGLE